MKIHSTVFSQNFIDKLKFLNSFSIKKMCETINLGYYNKTLESNDTAGVFNLSPYEQDLFKSSFIISEKFNNPKFVKIISLYTNYVYLGILHQFNGKLTLKLMDMIQFNNAIDDFFKSITN
jgi:hypothetical protein